MKHETVASSCIASIGYDKESETLEVLFVQGGMYQYSGVPVEVYEAFLEAGSKGQFFHSQIKGFYPYNRV